MKERIWNFKIFNGNDLVLFRDYILPHSTRISFFGVEDGRITILKNKRWYYIKPVIEKIKMDENFAIKLEKLVLTTHEEIQNIKTSDPDECQKYGIREEGKLNAIIVSLINKFLYANEGMIDFLSRLMFRLTNGHVFHNGNKRTALFVVSKLLHGFGIYISFSNDTKLYLTEWENFMLKIAKTSSRNENLILDEIKEKLSKSMWIDATSCI